MSGHSEQVAVLARRAMLKTLRQPFQLFPIIFFPLVLLGVNASGLKAAVHLPGFPTDSYISFAIAVAFIQGAMFSLINTGTNLAEDIENGFFNRLALTPLRRVSLIAGLLGGVAILGVIALLGIIMRNSVILLDQIGQDIDSGHDPVDAVIGSAVRRFRPIMLTAAAAVLALIPITRSVFWGPLAYAMMGGIIVATALTILVLPASYAFFFRLRRVTKVAKVEEAEQFGDATPARVG